MALRTQPPGDDGAAGAAMGTGGGVVVVVHYDQLPVAVGEGEQQAGVRAERAELEAGRGERAVAVGERRDERGRARRARHPLEVDAASCRIMPHHATRHPLEGDDAPEAVRADETAHMRRWCHTTPAGC